MNLPSLELARQALGMTGLILALGGVLSGHPLVVWLAIAFLATSVAIRVTEHIRRRRSE